MSVVSDSFLAPWDMANLHAAFARIGDPMLHAESGASWSDHYCTPVDCGKAVSSEPLSQSYCLDHFLLRCYQQLESFANEIGERGQGRNLSSTIAIRSAMEIAAQATVVGLRRNNLSNAERSRLMDIVLWANSLIQAVRRDVPWDTKH